MKMYGGEKSRFVECLCDCGNLVYKHFNNVRRGLSKSCGCMTSFLISKGISVHGMGSRKNKHPIYKAWRAMRARCYSKSYIGRKNYSEKGIIVCDEWKNNFMAFYEWAISNGWVKGLTLDRFPNKEGNYEPSNCRWATYAEQNMNRINTNFVTAFGETKHIQEWLKDLRCLVSYTALFYRLKRGMKPEEAICTPPKSSTKWL